MAIAPVSMSGSEILSDIIATTPDGETLRKCLQCGSCSGACPFGYVMELFPILGFGFWNWTAVWAYIPQFLNC